MDDSSCDSSPWQQSPTWYQAATLAERLAAGCSPADPDHDPERSRWRLDKWRRQAPFDDEDVFARRLALDGVDPAAFERLLGESSAATRSRFQAEPAWLELIREALDGAASDPDAELPFPPALLAGSIGGCLRMAAPFVRRERRRLRATLTRLASADAGLFDPERLEPGLWRLLVPHLQWTLVRTFGLELHIAGLEERLAGDTPEERFASFVDFLRDPARLIEIYESYPVLARQVAVRVADWCDAMIELFERLAADRRALVETFAAEADGDPGRLADVEASAGDRHRGGRTVQILRFASGLRLVYKPRPLRIGVCFAELLAWLGQRGAEPPLRAPLILDRGAYGWIEHIESRPCTAPDEVERFYRRQGAYLALLHALCAVDFHNENLRAQGEHPILLDLESLIHPEIGEPPRQSSGDLVQAELQQHSVLRIGLLPQRVWGSNGSEGIDLSGLGAEDGQIFPQKLPVWEGEGTDRMHLVRRELPMMASGHRPTLNGENVDLVAHTGAILEGFESLYRLLLEHREELLAPDGPLAAFADCEIRIVARATRTYGLLLQESFHPYLLGDALDRDRHFDRLWLGMQGREELEILYGSEREELHRGDLPMFSARLDSRHLLGVGGRDLGPLLKEPGLEAVQRKVSQLGEEDLEKQLWFIRASLAAHAPRYEPGQRRPRRPEANVAPAEALREGLVEAAREVGERLGTLAFRPAGKDAADDVAWVGLTPVGGRNLRLKPLGSDLYSGLPGVALFLAHLAAVTGDEAPAELARAALASTARLVEAEGPTLRSLGAFDGWGGLIYAFTEIGRLWGEPSWLDRVREWLEFLPPLIDVDPDHDVVGGAAGAIVPLLGFYEATGEARALEIAQRCGERLAAMARPQEEGVGWVAPLYPMPLAGFAHGGAGIAWALVELAARGGERCGNGFRALAHRRAREAHAYERLLLVPEVGNWRDLREIETPQLVRQIQGAQFYNGWCHGAPGIALARLAILRRAAADPELCDAALRRDVEIALATTLAEGFGDNHCLCHGDLGNLEPLIQARRVLGEERFGPHVERLARFVLQSIHDDGRQFGTAMGVESPGLMNGLAGIGYGLLRLAAPERVPAVLLLESH